jgi:hypothetical protein
MIKFSTILLKIGLIQLNNRNVLRWKKKRNIENLILALKKGNVSVRSVAAASLGSLRSQKSLPYLLRAVDDNVMYVSQAAIRAIEKIGIPPGEKHHIFQRKMYWSEYNKKFHPASLERGIDIRAENRKKKKLKKR